jgi:Tfp pilus assembly protein FimT
MNIGRPDTRGFTLIEMLVATAISMFLVGGGIAGYIQFNDRQTVVAGGKQLHSLLRTAQKKAMVGDKPVGCDVLHGYQVRTTNNSGQLTVYADCNNQDYLVITENMPGSVTAKSTSTVVFTVLHGGVTGATTLRVGQSTTIYEIDITAGGEISHGQFEQ